MAYQYPHPSGYPNCQPTAGYPANPQYPGGYPQYPGYPATTPQHPGYPAPNPQYPGYPTASSQYPGYPGASQAYPAGYPVYPGPGTYPANGAPPPYSVGPAPRAYYFIKSRLNSFVLDIEGASCSQGAKVITWSQKMTDNDNQLWYDDIATGTIRSKLTDFCLDFDGHSMVVQAYHPGNPNQQWERFESFIRNRITLGRVLDVSEKKKGGRVCAFDRHNGINQCFDFQFVTPQGISARPEERRLFYIVSQQNCKVLDIRGENPVTGVDVIIWTKKVGTARNQLWYFDQSGIIHSALNDFVMEAKVGGEKIKMMPYNGDPRQQWSLVGNKIVNKANECLDISGAKNNDGADIISYRYKGSANQHWRIEYP